MLMLLVCVAIVSVVEEIPFSVEKENKIYVHKIYALMILLFIFFIFLNNR